MTVRFKKRKTAIHLGELSGRLSRQGDVMTAVCSVRPLALATDEVVGKVGSAAFIFFLFFLFFLFCFLLGLPTLLLLLWRSFARCVISRGDGRRLARCEIWYDTV